MAETAPSTAPQASVSRFAYPPASAPDIIRSNQKDIHQTTILHTQLTSILRRLYGSRFVHAHDTALQSLSSFFYLSLTTLLGNRTLGEEYCGIHQTESVTGRLPSIERRSGYILSTVLLPYLLNRSLPSIRSRIKQRLEHRLSKTPISNTPAYRAQTYILENLNAATSLAPIYALTLTAFYFSGTYYHLSKRLFGLRYQFSRSLRPGEGEKGGSGYEVLGALLVIQMITQAYLHVQDILTTTTTNFPHNIATTTNDYNGSSRSNGSTQEDSAKTRLEQSTHTPRLQLDDGTTAAAAAHYDLADETTMSWLQPSQQQRKCTLCLEGMRDPSVTTCGHVFCWSCITGWLRERADCPLCRQGTGWAHVLPLRG